MTRPRVLFYVQHLLGVGHLYRACHISRAMAAAGMDVHLVSGGMPVPGLDVPGVILHRLTPLMCRDGDFRTLLTQDGSPAGNDFKQERSRQLLSIFNEIHPSVLVTEAFPFGRRQMRFELDPLLERARAARPSPLVVCSVRDILQAGDRPERARETANAVNAFFDHVLVHGDPGFAALDKTFPLAGEIASKLRYTGMVADPDRQAPAWAGNEHGEILVSAGGGAEGHDLLAAAVEARAMTSVRERHWRLLAGPNLAATWRERLSEATRDGITVEPNRPDFPSLLAGCALSISQAGYNTAVNLFECRCRSVLVPYAAHAQTEQTVRARRMQELGLAKMVDPENLSPASLAEAIDAAMEAPSPPRPGSIALNGAQTSAKLVASWLDHHTQRG